MLKTTLLTGMVLGLAATGQAGPPASYDDPEAFRESSTGGDTQPASFDGGEYLPVEYRGDILKNWEDAGLNEPEEEFEWVRVNDRAYLINLTSGFIKDTASLPD
ncbi:RcnB family protein [Henriciella marina]|uniref:RcnB family protein n=1 Tax=Henriciella marina TaxID=453851 RepID=UPI0003A0F795|nr:RcnB family protein [Henriciella marina]